MYDVLGPIPITGIFSINLMSVHNPAKVQQCRVIFDKSAADTKICLFFRYRVFFLRTLWHPSKVSPEWFEPVIFLLEKKFFLPLFYEGFHQCKVKFQKLL
jgi:hypothetical protein